MALRSGKSRQDLEAPSKAKSAVQTSTRLTTKITPAIASSSRAVTNTKRPTPTSSKSQPQPIQWSNETEESDSELSTTNLITLEDEDLPSDVPGITLFVHEILANRKSAKNVLLARTCWHLLHLFQQSEKTRLTEQKERVEEQKRFLEQTNRLSALINDSHQSATEPPPRMQQLRTYANIVANNSISNHNQPQRILPPKPVTKIKITAAKQGEKATDLIRELDLSLSQEIISSRSVGTGDHIIVAKTAEAIDAVIKELHHEKLNVRKFDHFDPRLEVLVPDSLPDDKVANAFGEGVRIVTSFKAKSNNKFVIVAVPPALFQSLMITKLVFIESVSYRIRESLSAQRCGHCQRFGHSTKSCNRKKAGDQPVCANCSHTHSTSSCTASDVCCINCTRDKRPNSSHRASDHRSCPVAQLFIQQRLNQTNYRL